MEITVWWIIGEFGMNHVLVISWFLLLFLFRGFQDPALYLESCCWRIGGVFENGPVLVWHEGVIGQFLGELMCGGLLVSLA